MTDQILLSKSQNPKRRMCVLREGYIMVLSECCDEEIDIDTTTEARNTVCWLCREPIMREAAYARKFPVTALTERPRASNYWYQWGKSWFGLEEFGFEASI